MSYPMCLPFPLDLVSVRGHTVFTGYRSLNLVGVRQAIGTPGRMDDLLYALWKDGKGDSAPWHGRVWQLETEPGRPFLQNPMNKLGTAIMKAGQYRGAYRIGQHKGRPALEQHGAITVYRDNDRDGFVDIVPGSEDTSAGHKVNVHDIADPHGLAGCQGMWSADLAELLAVCRTTTAIYGPDITYTLLEPSP